MILLADECIDKQIVDYIRNCGYGILYVTEIETAISDDEVLKLANEKSAILLTGDKDFGEFVFRQQRLNQGIILLRMSRLSSLQQAKIVVAVIENHVDEISQAFTVISPGLVRIRLPER
ncbi:MAG: DUF5615 family PIN-like protein [Candidatus Electryoneaceae bacterium]|nr:DUF5615 family PIN-like protein [Candidatus Electryoneaceae bacterium]